MQPLGEEAGFFTERLLAQGRDTSAGNFLGDPQFGRRFWEGGLDGAPFSYEDGIYGRNPITVPVMGGTVSKHVVLKVRLLHHLF